MTDQRAGVVAGVDAHTDEHHVAVVDGQGRLLGAAVFPTSAEGYARLIGWLRRYGEIDRVGVESTGAYAAGLVRELVADGIRVVEVNQTHPHARQRLGKSDPIDAELAARVWRQPAGGSPPRSRWSVSAPCWPSRSVLDALKARTAALDIYRNVPGKNVAKLPGEADTLRG
jgi:transposase